MVEVLLAHDIDISARDFLEWSALDRAVSTGQLEITEMLLRCGADFSQCDSRGITVIHIAVSFCQQDVVRATLEHGANVFADSDGKTPQYKAAYHGMKKGCVGQER